MDIDKIKSNQVIGIVLSKLIKSELPFSEMTVNVFYDNKVKKFGATPNFLVDEYGEDESDKQLSVDVWYFQEDTINLINEVDDFRRDDWFKWTSTMLQERLPLGSRVIYDKQEGYVSFLGMEKVILGNTFEISLNSIMNS